MNAHLVQRSFDLISLKGDEFTERFYQKLFADHPSVVGLFAHVDMERQRKKLFAMLTLAITNLERMDVVQPVLRELGQRHVGYGVGDEHYDAFVETFLATLGECLPEHWSLGTAEGWRAALDQISLPMRSESPSASGTHQIANIPSKELQVLMQVSGQSTLSATQTQLFSSFLAKQLHDHDLALAREVQQTLLPRDLPAPAGYRIEACYEPARQVGGDYYDCFELDDGRVCIAFGDVVGKGVHAALVMARLASAVQTTVRLSEDLCEAISAINVHMCHRSSRGRFVTFLLLRLDPAAHAVELVNAGHRPPVVRGADGSLREFAPESAGVPLGILEESSYEAAQLELESGEAIVIFTDGVDEARNPSGEHYGEKRAHAFLESQAREASTLGHALLADVRRFAAGRPASDDIAIVTLARE